MSHYAELDDNNVVLRVIVCDDDKIAQIPGRWMQTSYNATIRKCFAGVGYTYDTERDAFIAPKPYPSWTLDESSCQWLPPIPRPEGRGWWDEETKSWKSE